MTPTYSAREEDCDPSAKCVLCGGRLHQRYHTPDRMYPIPGSFCLAQCIRCGLQCLDPQPKADILGKHYPLDSYYSYQADTVTGQPMRSSVRSYLKEQAYNPKSRILGSILRGLAARRGDFLPLVIRLRSSGRVLDIGCGNGKLLDQFKKRGFETYGLEISEEAASMARAKGHCVFSQNLAHAELEGAFFDIVTMVHTLEHMADPLTIMAEIGHVLKTQGVLFIAVPNIDGVVSRLFGQWYYGIDSPRHLYCFSVKTLRAVAGTAGFRHSRIDTPSSWQGVYLSARYVLDSLRRAAFYDRFFPGTQGFMCPRWLQLALTLPLIFADFAKTGDAVHAFFVKD